MADEMEDLEKEQDTTAPQEPTIPMEHRLAKPIRANGEDVQVLTWREPTAGVIERAGNPIMLEFNGTDFPTMTFNEKKMNAMISTLCAIPPSSVRMLPAGEWQAIAYKLSRFFMPTMG